MPAIAFDLLHSPGWSTYGQLVPAPLSGSKTVDVIPVPIHSRTESGGIVGMYGANEWNDRLHVLPSLLSVGTVRQPATEQVRLYNAGRNQATINSVAAQGSSGIEVTHPPAPYTLGAKRSALYNVNIELDGPERIDARYTFDSDTDAILIIQGRRLVAQVWFVPPDWTEPVVETWQWRTDLQRAHDGTEVRRPIYQHARRGLRFRVVTDDIAAVDRLVSGWQSRLYNVPRWPDKRRLTAPANAGDTEIQLDTTVGEWRHDTQIVLLGADGTAEAPVVLSINPDSIEITEPLVNDWPAGARVYPARLMRLPGAVQFERAAAGIITGEVNFLADEDTETPYVAADSPTEFDGLPVYLHEPNRVQAGAADYMDESRRFDAPGGLVLVDDPTGDPVHGHTWRFDWGTRGDADAFIAWLLAREGRVNAFGFPTWSVDMHVAGDIVPDQQTLDIEPIEWDKFYSDRRNRNVIALQDRSGTWRFAKVISASMIGGIEQLALDRALVESPDPTITINQIRRICWLETVRLAADRVEVAWRTDSVVRSEISVRGVPA